jgi:ribonuclease P protein component
MKTTFHKEERLKSNKLIEALVKEGNTVNAMPLKLVWMEVEKSGRFPARATVAVSKRNFKRAVDRNKLKRRMREAYRLNKQPLYEQLLEKNKKISLMFFHVSKEISAYELIAESMIKAMEKLRKAL